MDDDQVAKLIVPFYLQMMGMNAVSTSGRDLLPEVARIGRSLDPSEVVELLEGGWRLRVMGAWFSVVRDEPEVVVAVLASLETSLGALTSPPLATAAVVLAGSEAASALATYALFDSQHDAGACGFVSAAAQYVGASVCCSPTDGDRRAFAEMLSFAEQLAAAP